MRDQNCTECNRLWRDYAFATNADIKLNGQVKLAALTHDPELSEQLAPIAEAARTEAGNVHAFSRERGVVS
jgi:hypothetical protein